MLDTGELKKHLVALARGDVAAQRQAIRYLKDVEPQDWAAASADAVSSLVESLQHELLGEVKPGFAHKDVAIILGNIGPRAKPAVPQLIRLLQDGIPDTVRETAATALGKLGKDARAAVDHLIALADGKGAPALQAVRALGEIGCDDQRVRSALVSSWLSPVHSQHGQIQVAVALCKLGIDAKGLHAFLTNTLMANQDASLRKAAASALAWCGKDELDVVPALLSAALSDQNEDVLRAAQASLDQLKVTNEKAVHLCAKQLEDSSFAETALRKSGQLAVPALIVALGNSEPLTREKAARTLGCLGELAMNAVDALTSALHDRDLGIRLAAAKSLWSITKKPDVVVPALVHLLEEKRHVDLDDSEARRRFLQTVIEALWRIGPPAKASLPALIDKTKDKNRHISESAQNALRKIAPSNATEAEPRSQGQAVSSRSSK